MQTQQNVSLANHSSMGLGGTAAHVAEITDRMQVPEALSWAREQQLPVLMIGGGSNIVWRDEGFAGLLLVNKIPGYKVFDEDSANTYLTIGAGEDWDSVVERSVAAGLTGIEGLSLIPGTAGAVPVQNVGAYGQDISQTLVTVEAFDTSVNDFVTLTAADCDFGYRSSRFNRADRGRFFITSLTLHLTKGNPQPPFYAALASYFESQGITDHTPVAMRQAVIALRSAKLPSVATVHNNGSFFANPVISAAQALDLQASFPTMPQWPVEETGEVKIPAAWLIEQAGFKDYHDDATGMATWPTQPLVLVNEHARNTADLLAFKQKVVDAVQAKFGITLVQEPELLPLT